MRLLLLELLEQPERKPKQYFKPLNRIAWFNILYNLSPNAKHSLEVKFIKKTSQLDPRKTLHLHNHILHLSQVIFNLLQSRISQQICNSNVAEVRLSRALKCKWRNRSFLSNLNKLPKDVQNNCKFVLTCSLDLYRNEHILRIFFELLHSSLGNNLRLTFKLLISLNKASVVLHLNCILFRPSQNQKRKNQLHLLVTKNIHL